MISKYNKGNVYSVAIVSRILSVFISLITSCIVNRYLGPKLKGEYAYIINWTTLLINLFSFGLAQTCCTYRKEYGNQVFKLFIKMILFHSLSLILAVVYCLVFAIDKSILFLFVLTSAGVARFNLLYLYGIFDVKKRDIFNVYLKAVIVLGTGVTIFISTMDHKLERMFLCVLLGDLFCAIYLTRTFKMALNNEKKWYVSILEIYKLSFWSMLFTVLGVLNYSIDIIFLKKLSTMYSVGIYSVAIYISNIIWLIPDALKDVIYNKTSKGEIDKGIVTVSRYAFWVTSMLCLLFCVFGKPLIIFIYGYDYSTAYNSAVLLIVGHMCMIFYKIIHPYYVAEGEQKKIAIVLSISVGVNCILNSILIPLYDTNGAAVASILSYLLCSMVFVFKFSLKYKIKCRNFILIKQEDFSNFKDFIFPYKNNK